MGCQHPSCATLKHHFDFSSRFPGSHVVRSDTTTLAASCTCLSLHKRIKNDRRSFERRSFVVRKNRGRFMFRLLFSLRQCPGQGTLLFLQLLVAQQRQPRFRQLPLLLILRRLQAERQKRLFPGFQIRLPS